MFLSSALLTLFVGLSAQAANNSYSINSEKLTLSPLYIEKVDLITQDYAVLHNYQLNRTAADCREADSQSIPSSKSFFKSILSPAELAKVEPLGKKIITLVGSLSKPFKIQFERERPYNVDTTLKPCAQIPGGRTSYPSSHAAMGLVLADIYSQIFPEKKSELLAYGLRIGELRVIGGVHHPSDVEAGQELGRQILVQLKTNTAFIQEMKALRQRL